MSIRTFALETQERALILKQKMFGSTAGRLKTLAGVVVIIVLIACGVLLLRANYGKKDTQHYKQMVSEVDKANVNGDDAKAKRLALDYLKKPSSNKSYAAEADIRVSQACYNLQDYSCANDYAKKALSLDGDKASASLYSMLGDINQQLKNDKEAIDYYKRALELLKNDKSPASSAQAYGIQSNIGYLEGGRKDQ